VGQLDHRGLVLGSVADEGQGELAAGIVLLAQQRHAQGLRVERDRAIEIADPNHGVQDPHFISLRKVTRDR
jgi:hypothetical protein